MVLPDINILVHAFRADAEEHDVCREWLLEQLNGPSDFALLRNVLSGFLRVVTHPRVFREPSPLGEALGFCQVLVDCELSHWIEPGDRHWKIFVSLCRDADARGNLIPDAWFAAVAIEHGCEWVTLDRDFARFSELKWRAP